MPQEVAAELVETSNKSSSRPATSEDPYLIHLSHFLTFLRDIYLTIPVFGTAFACQIIICNFEQFAPQSSTASKHPSQYISDWSIPSRARQKLIVRQVQNPVYWTLERLTSVLNNLHSVTNCWIPVRTSS